MMHRNIRRCLLGTAFAGSLLAFSGVAANAADTTTSGNDGLLSGTQVVAPVTIPVNLGGTSVGVLGDSAASVDNAGTTGTNAPTPAPAAPAPAASTNGSDGTLSGTQVVAPVTVPVDLGATSLGLLGDSSASTQNAGTPTAAPDPAPAPAASTSGSDGVASGTQVVAPITVPITVGATSVGLVGDSAANTQSPAASGTGAPQAAPAPAPATSGSDGIASGTQVVAPVAAPINLGATSLGLVGDSAASVEGSGTNGSTRAPATPATTGGTDGILSGTQVVAPVTAPINLGATSLGLVGDSAASVEGSGTTGTAAAPTGPATIGGTGGLLSGTQIVAPITAPISLGATSLGAVGDSTATAVNPPVVTPPVVTPPVVAPPVVTPPTVTNPSVTTPVVEVPAAGTTEVIAAAAPMQGNYASAPSALAKTGVNTGMLMLGLLFLAFGGLLTLVLRRKQS